MTCLLPDEISMSWALSMTLSTLNVPAWHRLGHPVDQSSVIHDASDCDIGWCSLEVDDDILPHIAPCCLQEVLTWETALIVVIDFDSILVAVLQIDPEFGMLIRSLDEEMSRWDWLLELDLLHPHHLLLVEPPQTPRAEVEAVSSLDVRTSFSHTQLGLSLEQICLG